MTVRVAINGFGRIGRLVLRSIVEHGRRDIEVVAINDLGPVATNAHLLKYDSVHGRFPGTVTSGEDWIDVGTGKIRVTAELDPSKLPHKDLYRARAASLSMIPTSTGAAKAVGLVLPELKGKLDGSSIRVPTPNVSVVDLKVVASRDTSVEEINAAIQSAADGAMKGVLATTTDPVVSMDMNHIAASSTVALPQTQVIEGKLARVLSWYDNEWGFATRMSDTALAMSKLI